MDKRYWYVVCVYEDGDGENYINLSFWKLVPSK